VIIEQTVEIPVDHRLTIDVPREVPAGPVLITFTPKEADSHAGETVFPSIEALKLEAARKAERRFADPSGDSLQRFCGSLAHIYTEDGVAIQRRMRDEWER
jgi:hypothetical protein